MNCSRKVINWCDMLKKKNLITQDSVSECYNVYGLIVM